MIKDKLTFDEMPRECKSTVKMVSGVWVVCEPKCKHPRYVLAEQITLGWVVRANQRLGLGEWS